MIQYKKKINLLIIIQIININYIFSSILNQSQPVMSLLPPLNYEISYFPAYYSKTQLYLPLNKRQLYLPLNEKQLYLPLPKFKKKTYLFKKTPLLDLMKKDIKKEIPISSLLFLCHDIHQPSLSITNISDILCYLKKNNLIDDSLIGFFSELILNNSSPLILSELILGALVLNIYNDINTIYNLKNFLYNLKNFFKINKENFKKIKNHESCFLIYKLLLSIIALKSLLEINTLYDKTEKEQEIIIEKLNNISQAILKELYKNYHESNNNNQNIYDNFYEILNNFIKIESIIISIIKNKLFFKRNIRNQYLYRPYLHNYNNLINRYNLINPNQSRIINILNYINRKTIMPIKKLKKSFPLCYNININRFYLDL